MSEAASDGALAAGAYCLMLDDLAIEVLGRFERRGIDGLLLKGNSFASWLWPGERRPYGDVDLLVSPADYETAGSMLRELGYEPLQEDPSRSTPEKSRPWGRPDGLVVDLHRGLVGINLRDDESWAVLWGRRELVPVGSQTVFGLDEPARTLHVVLHTAQHNRQDKPMRDLERALERVPLDVWHEAAALSAMLDATEAFGSGLRLFEKGVRLARILLVDEAITVDVALRVHDAPKLAHGIERVAEARGLSARARVLRRRLAPPPAHMRHSYALARRGPVGLVAAYWWRWVVLSVAAPRALVHWIRARHLARRSRQA